MAARTRAISSARGAIRLLWNGAATPNFFARRAPRAFARVMARSTAASSPEITVWFGSL